MASKKEEIEKLKAFAEKLQKFYEVFYELMPCDIIPPPTIGDIKEELIQKADSILDRPEKHDARMIRYATLLKDKQVRSKRADILMARWQRREEQRKAKAEEIARIADKYGFDGSLFRELFPVEDPLSIRQAERLTKKIETIPRIIASIEKPVDKSAIPRDVALLTVSQVATILGWSESVVRQKDREGLLPEPYRFGGTIQWGRKELESWISAGCPNRQQWEQRKQRTVV
jgi:predicted DNA-binding transcriptional regulator AlpA